MKIFEYYDDLKMTDSSEPIENVNNKYNIKTTENKKQTFREKAVKQEKTIFTMLINSTGNEKK